MIYHVQARFRRDTAADLLRKLNDGSIANQQPDGAELMASMTRAVVVSGDQIEWSEMCLCPTPLYHERATVLDAHFDEIRTSEIPAHRAFAGRRFLDYLQELAG